MSEVRKGGLSLFVETTKLVGDVAVGICFPLDCNSCAFQNLNGRASCSSQCFPQGAEEAALGYSLGVAVRQTLCGNPLAVSKTKVGAVEFVVHNGMFGINWKVKGTGSAVRKSIGLALKVLDPSRMFSTYARCVKQLSGSPDKDTFAYVADAASKAINSNLQVAIVGNIKLDKEKLNDMLEVLVKKHESTAPKGSKTKPSSHTSCDHANQTEVKVTGWQSAVVADYIRAKVPGLEPNLCSKTLLMPIKQSQWDTLAGKLKKGVKDFAQAKYTKVGSDLPAVFAYLTLANAQLCAADVKSAISSKLSASAIESAITKAL